MSHDADTIFALSSGRPPAAIAVVRVSGPRAGDALRALAGRLPAPRQAMLARLRARTTEDGRRTTDDQTTEDGRWTTTELSVLRPPSSVLRNAALDDALVLWFPAPASETGEDTAEFQLHGGRAVVAAVLAALAAVPGLRPAEAGEFTRRAFANGKLDLTRVEGLADLIGAETEAQRRQAFRQLTGLLGDRAETWRRRLIEALALAEAAIDFPDEDVPHDLLGPALAAAAQLSREMHALLADAGRGERLRDGLTVAVAGPVNVGKSSIVNRLARRPAAIVSPFAGTTRDVIEVHLDLAGYPVTVLDTAGLREAADPVEQEGVRRARARAAEADLVLWVVDATGDRMPASPAECAGEEFMLSSPAECTYKEFMPSALPVPGSPPQESEGGRARDTLPAESHGPAARPPTWIVFNKCDLVGKGVLVDKDGALADGFGAPPPRNFRISAETGEGFDLLADALAAFAGDFFATGEAPVITRQRHRHALQSCAEALDRAVAEGGGPAGREDVIAEDLRLAARALGRLTGRVDVEDILDVIFRDFCIGK
jgi:tRNA modification GTPase